ncbi:MAG: outer membrane protein assembly factor, partial [Candidatus Zixiibacteriota bacterium]
QSELKTPSDASAAELRNHLLNKSFLKKELITQLKKITNDLNLFEIETKIIPLEKISNDTLAVLLELNAYQNFLLSNTRVLFSGNTIFDDSLLIKQLLYTDSIITTQILKKGINRIVALYNSKGYDFVDINHLKVIPETKTIYIYIDEAIIKSINVEKNRRTKDWFIKSYFPLKPGQPYSTSWASDGIANIYGTDLFNRVTVNVHPSDSGALVNIGVEEKQYNQIRLGWHWDDEFHSEESIEILDDNIAGIGLEAVLHARYAIDRQNYHLSIKTNRIFSTYLTSRVIFYHRRLNRQLYFNEETQIGRRKEIKTGFDIIVGQQIARLGTVSAGLIMEEVEYKYPLPISDDKFGLRIVKLESLVENFDRVPFPSTGNKHLFQLKLVGKLLGGDVEFNKFITSHEAYFPLSKYLNYHPKLAIGVSSAGLPSSEQFYLGGIHSFVGFQRYQLSGDKMIIFSNEIRLNLPFYLYLTGRYDMGEVYNGTDQIKLRNLRHGVGVSLAIDSPIGPFEFVYGVVANNPSQFYLNIGLDF